VGRRGFLKTTAAAIGTAVLSQVPFAGRSDEDVDFSPQVTFKLQPERKVEQAAPSFSLNQREEAALNYLASLAAKLRTKRGEYSDQADAIQEMIEKYLTDEHLKETIEMNANLISYPDDGYSEEELFAKMKIDGKAYTRKIVKMR